MPDTFDATLGTIVMTTGGDGNSWGTNANASVFQILVDAIANILPIATATGTVDLSTNAPPLGPSGARYWQLSTTASLSGNLTIQVPNLSKEWLFNNACTLNGHTVQVKTPSGAAVTIPSGFWKIWCDGNNVINLFPAGSKQVLMPDGSASAPAYSSVNEPNSGWDRAGTQDWRLSINGIDTLQVTGAGASSPSLVNILSGFSLAFAGVPFSPTSTVPTGGEMPFAGIFAPSGWLLEFGQAISRATYANLLSVITATCTGNTHTNTTIDNLSIDLRTLGVEGAFIEGIGVSLGTTIVSVNSATSITISGAASGSSSGLTIRILPYGQGDGSTTFNIPDRRDRVIAGRGNMGGTDAALLTLAQSQGILGTKLNATGGEQGHTMTIPEVPAITPTGTIGGTQSLGSLWVNGGVNNIPNTGPLNISVVATTVLGSNFTFAGASFGGGGAHNNVQPTGISNMIIKT